MKIKSCYILTGFLLVVLDQWTKWWTVSHLALGELRIFMPPIFSLTYLRNHGAAFSLLQNQQVFFAIVTVLVLGGASYYFVKQEQSKWLTLLGLTLIISGGLGNFIDRLRLGYVVDMVHLDFMDFAIFNVADSYLSIGVLLLMLALWREE